MIESKEAASHFRKCKQCFKESKWAFVLKLVPA